MIYQNGKYDYSGQSDQDCTKVAEARAKFRKVAHREAYHHDNAEFQEELVEESEHEIAAPTLMLLAHKSTLGLANFGHCILKYQN